jgi:hypothetical protein
MKNGLGWLVALVVVGGGSWFAYNHFNGIIRAQSYKLELSELKRDFLIDAEPLAQLEPEAYRRDVGEVLAKYFRRLGTLAKSYPDQYDIDREAKKSDGAKEGGKSAPAGQKELKEERIKLAQELFTKMKDGQYRPLYSASDKGFRFDIVDVTPSQGEQKITLSFVHWGPFGRDKEGAGAVDYRAIFGNMKAAQVKGKLIEVPQITADGPPSLTFAPDRWVAESIPGVSIGYYELPLLPRVAETVELSFEFALRSVGGGEALATVKFAPIPIPDAWKLPEGAQWDAQERIATDEELQAAGAKGGNKAAPTP